jgi:hypothetical protein
VREPNTHTLCSRHLAVLPIRSTPNRAHPRQVAPTTTFRPQLPGKLQQAPVVRCFRDHCEEAPLQLVAKIGDADRPVPDPSHRSAAVGVRCRREQRREIPFVQQDVRYDPRRHKQWGLRYHVSRSSKDQRTKSAYAQAKLSKKNFNLALHINPFASVLDV